MCKGKVSVFCNLILVLLIEYNPYITAYKKMSFLLEVAMENSKFGKYRTNGVKNGLIGLNRTMK